MKAPEDLQAQVKKQSDRIEELTKGLKKKD